MINDIELEKITFNYKEELGIGYFDYKLNGIDCYARLFKGEDGIWRVRDFFHEQIKLNQKCPFCEEIREWEDKKDENVWGSAKCYGVEKYEKELLEKLTSEPSVRLRNLMKRINIEPRKEKDK